MKKESIKSLMSINDINIEILNNEESDVLNIINTGTSKSVKDEEDSCEFNIDTLQSEKLRK